MKKFVSVALAVLVLLMAFPTVIFADEATTVAKIVDAQGTDVAGKTAYTDINAALDDVASNETIVLLADVSTAHLSKLGADGNKTFTVDGKSQYSLTLTGNAYHENGTNNVTFKDIKKITLSKGFNVASSGSLTLNNCEVVTTAFPFRTANAGAAQINITGCRITINAADTGILVTTNTKDKVFNITGSTIRTTVGADAAHWGNNGVFNVANNASVTVNLTNSTLESAVTSTGANACIAQVGSGCTLNVNTDAASVLYISTAATNKSGFVFFKNDGTLNITGATPIYKVSAYVASKGVTLPTVYNDNQVAYGWKVVGTADTELISNPYTATVTGDVSFTTVDVDPANNPMNLAYIEVNSVKTYYTDISAAVNAVADGQTIVLMKNISGNLHIPSRTAAWSFTIDGKGYTWEGEGYLVDNLGFANVALKNIHFKGGLRWDTWVDLKYDNEGTTTDITDCTFITNNAIMFKMGGGTYEHFVGYHVNMTRVNMTHGGTDRVFLIEKIPQFDLNMTDVNITKNNRGTKDWETLMLVDSNVGTADVSITGNSTICMAASGVATETQEILYFRATQNASTLTLGEGVTMKLSGTSAHATPIYYLLRVTDPAKVQVVDKGATWITTSEILAKGLSTHTETNAAQATLLGWKIGGKLYQIGSVKISNLTGDVTLTPALFSADDFRMANTVSMRVDGENSGLRFKMQISNALLTFLGDSFQGAATLLAPSFSLYGEELTIGLGVAGTDYLLATLDSAQANGGWSDTDDTHRYLRAVLVGIDTANQTAVDMDFTARGYIEIAYADGTLQKVYTANSVEASLFDAATLAQANGYADNAVVQQILTTHKA